MARKERRPSRAIGHARLLEAAKSVHVPPQVDICVAGGGAGGIVAAILAAERGASVVVLERDVECGRTILATGNGRCNFANARLDPELYNEPEFVRTVCGDSWLDDVLGFFADCGLAWEEEAEGRLYPLSRQAASVRNVLVSRARRAGVTLATAREVVGLRPSKDGFEVTVREAFGPQGTSCLRAQAAIIATGGGSLANGNQLCSDLAVPIQPDEPVLCPLACEGLLPPELDGRRVRSEVTLRRDGRILQHRHGEVLLRTYGLSGIVVFDLSRFAGAGDVLELDLLPGLDAVRAEKLGRDTLDGLLDPIVAAALVAHAGDLRRALGLAKSLPYRVTGPAEANRAQVTRGGLLVNAFDPRTLRAKDDASAMARLYACGEALDVDGPCGGYNLAWAWKSGMVAGTAAAKETSR